MSEPRPLPMGKITIGYYLDGDGHPMTAVAMDEAAEELPIVVILGLLDLAKDSLLHPEDDS